MVGSYDWLKSGYTLVPTYFLNHFGELNLTADEGLLLLLLLSKLSQEQSEHDTMAFATQLGWEPSKLFDVLNHLMMKQYIAIELIPDASGKQTDHYSLRPFFEQLDKRFGESIQPRERDGHQPKSGNIVELFEKEFGRVLTPLELEMITNWINTDKYSFDLVKLALREAVMRQALSLKYIDRILISWDKKNIRTVAEAEKEIQQFDLSRGNTTKQASQDIHYDVPLVNWKRSSE